MTLPLRGWSLEKIEDGGHNCEYPRCGVRIRWEYHLTHPDVSTGMIVGSECVKSFIGDGDADAALDFFKRKWTQRRGYYYKMAHGRVFVIGVDPWGRWYVAYTPSVKTWPWRYSKHKYKTYTDAADAVTRLVFRGYRAVADACPLERAI